MTTELTNNFDKICIELVRKHGLVCEELTEQHIADSIKQAMLANDFQRNVLVHTQGNLSQKVTYLPGLGNDTLRAENQRLRNLLAKHGIDEEEEEIYTNNS